MGSCNFGSQRLITLAEQLRLYKPPPPPPLSLHGTNDNNPINENSSKIQQTTENLPSHDLHSNAQSASAHHHSHERSKRMRAAVLICLFEDDHGELCVILTKRSSTLSSHSGEVALPGGKTEEGDADDVETALREAKEEIGLDPLLVNVVSVIEPFTNKRGMTVIPVIGILFDNKAFKPNPNPAEVEAIFNAPLEMFLKDENQRAEEREWNGYKYLLHYFDHEAEHNKYVIWGLTAGILITAASIVYQRPPAFLERKPNFWHSAADKDTSSS